MSSLTIDNTGVRNNEYISGFSSSKQTKGVMAQIRFLEGVFFPPYRPYFVPNDIRIRDTLIWGFFENMSFEQRLRWIYENGIENELHLSDIPCQIRFENIDSDFTSKLSTDNQTFLMSGEWLNIQDVYNMFPRKPGSKAVRHTLIFRGSNWGLVNPDTSFNYAEYLSMISKTTSNHRTDIKVYKSSIEFQGGKFYVGVCDNEPELDLNQYCHPEIMKIINWFTPAVHKSLIQKCIRVRPLHVKANGEIYKTEDVLITSFIMLLKNPGVLVPNLRKFVTGTEAAFKRLAVSLIEDSTCSFECILLLLSASLASRNGYKPSKTFIEYCIKSAIDGLSSTYFVYDWHNIKGFQLHQMYQRVILMIKTLGSFESDINMIITMFENNMQTIKSELERPLEMEIYHCLDQHSITEIAHFYTGPEIKADDIFGVIWKNGTGINSRKREFLVDPNVADAQRRLWIAKTSIDRVERELSKFTFTSNRNLDQSWISGLIGPISNKIPGDNLGFPSKTIPIVSFYDPDDFNKVMTIREPSRDSDVEITDQIKNYASKLIEYQMSNKLTSIKSEMLQLSFSVLYRMGDFICIDSKNNQINWKDYCESDFTIPIIRRSLKSNLDGDVINAFTKKSCGIENKSIPRINKLLSCLDIQIVSRMAMYLRNINPRLEIYKISRDGTGTYLETHWSDSVIFRFLLKLCVIIPGVIEITNELYFKIKYFPYWNIVRNLIFNKISSYKYDQWSIRGDLVKFSDTRILRDNQKNSVKRLLSRIKSGKRGNIIFIDTGLGKTLIVLNTIGRLIDKCRMPKYCIYVLTSSSVENILEQIKMSGLPYNFLIGTKENSNRNIYPNCLNLILHDHMRMMNSELLAVAFESFIVFDEVHMMFEDSKRSSIALQLSKICNTFVAMTGTLIKGKDVTSNNLLEWVSQVVNFEVNKDNYYIGIATLISGRVELPIKKNYIEKEVQLINSEYANYVESKYGGNSDTTDFHKATEICFESIFEGMIKEITSLLQNGEKCVFVVVKNIREQDRMFNILTSLGIKCFSIGSKNSINLTAENNKDGIQVVITTFRNNSGYDVTAARIMITAPYFTDECTRQQLEGRIHRISQHHPEVFYISLHCGLLSYTMKNHNLARIISKSIRDTQKEV